LLLQRQRVVREDCAWDELGDRLCSGAVDVGEDVGVDVAGDFDAGVAEEFGDEFEVAGGSRGR
jgi:hypothetical protein